MLRAVIFDFDGVITDSEVLHFRTFNEVLAPHDIVITKSAYYSKYLGLTDLDLFTLMADRGQIERSEINNLIKQKNQLFEELAKTEGHIIEGVRDLLQLLRDNNIRIAICSGALLSEIELVLQQANLPCKNSTKKPPPLSSQTNVLSSKILNGDSKLQKQLKCTPSRLQILMMLSN